MMREVVVCITTSRIDFHLAVAIVARLRAVPLTGLSNLF